MRESLIATDKKKYFYRGARYEKVYNHPISSEFAGIEQL